MIRYITISILLFVATLPTFAQNDASKIIPAISILLLEEDDSECDSILTCFVILNGTTIDTTNSTYDPDCESLLECFVVNNTQRSSEIFTDGTQTTGVLEDIQSVTTVTEDGIDFISLETTGIPQYDVIISAGNIDELNNRPRAQTNDFLSGETTAVAGDTVVFGQDIGYGGNLQTICETTGGYGYWPPGPDCASNTESVQLYPANPNEEVVEECSTGLDNIGVMINGASIFNWGDGMSYNNAGAFQNLAPLAEFYDVDICGGHAASGNYHHHGYTTCLADLVGDDGSDHSPIYGVMADGYPLYGPYESNATLAKSGWLVRDYDSETNETGCSDGARSCVMVDAFDASLGTEVASSNGPAFDEEVESLSSNLFIAYNGFYFEDYYYGGATATGAQLDEHNGHDNNDGRGYHYHITLEQADSGGLAPAFPFIIGPSFYGEVHDNAVANCSGDAGGGGGPGGGGPGGGGPPGL